MDEIQGLGSGKGRICTGMLDAFFTPVPESVWAPFAEREHCVGSHLQIHRKAFPKLKKAKLALLGIGSQAHEVRKILYALQWRFGSLSWVDLGNLVETDDARQNQFALSEAMGELQEIGLTVLVLGGSSASAFPIYKGFRSAPEAVELVQVSPDIDWEEGSALRQILVDQPSKLFNLDFIGTQAYYVSDTTAGILDKMYFENHRLGEVKGNPELVEPILRSAHALFFDLAAVRGADAPEGRLQNPNGFQAEEAVRIARYAGISNKLSAAQLYGAADHPMSNTLLAQMLWYFADGYFARYYDHPSEGHSDFLIYRNRLTSTQHEIVFYKSRKSERWWMEIPHPYENLHFYIGCSYADYQRVCDDEMPDRWWRAYQRLM